MSGLEATCLSETPQVRVSRDLCRLNVVFKHPFLLQNNHEREIKGPNGRNVNTGKAIPFRILCLIDELDWTDESD